MVVARLALLLSYEKKLLRVGYREYSTPKCKKCNYKNNTATVACT